MTSHVALPLAASAMPWVMGHIDLAVAALITLACLVAYGAKDLFRFSPLRARAVASVCFHESIRRRVLWLTPLAIVGVVLVSQFQRPLDDQDAIRQTTRFCVFASGLLVTVAAIILACTNIPREIESRVIYTVVTKPTSRLEILVGKIAGFSAVSAIILLIMGVFSWGYLNLREWRLMDGVRGQIAAGGMDPATEQTLKYYAEHGLLNARDYRNTLDVQAMAAYPAADEKVRWFNGGGEQEVLVPFRVDPASIRIGSGDTGMLLAISLQWKQRQLTAEEEQAEAQMADAAHLQNAVPVVPAGPGVAPAAPEKYPAFVHVSFYSPTMMQLAELPPTSPIPVPDATGQTAAIVPVPANLAQQVLSAGSFYVAVGGVSPGTRFGVSGAPVSLLLPSDDPQKPMVIRSQQFSSLFAVACPILGRTAQNGQQLRGDVAETAPVGIFAYRNRELPSTGKVNIEFHTVVDRQGEEDPAAQRPTIVELSVVNRQTGKASPALRIPVESRRSAHATLPVESLAGGDFDVLVRCLTPGQWIGLTPVSVRLAAGDGVFWFNLLKSYLVLWLLSVLVIAVAIFSSTFLSWPIAVVLTVVILLGHWGVSQLGDMAAPGVGRQVVNDLFAGAAPAVTETLTRSMEGLSSLIRVLAAFLPDISQFTAMEDISEGSAVPMARLAGPLAVLIVFGLPILGLSYVFFRNKEVAP